MNELHNFDFFKESKFLSICFIINKTPNVKVPRSILNASTRELAKIFILWY